MVNAMHFFFQLVLFNMLFVSKTFDIILLPYICLYTNQGFELNVSVDA